MLPFRPDADTILHTHIWKWDFSCFFLPAIRFLVHYPFYSLTYWLYLLHGSMWGGGKMTILYLYVILPLCLRIVSHQFFSGNQMICSLLACSSYSHCSLLPYLVVCFLYSGSHLCFCCLPSPSAVFSYSPSLLVTPPDFSPTACSGLNLTPKVHGLETQSRVQWSRETVRSGRLCAYEWVEASLCRVHY